MRASRTLEYWTLDRERTYLEIVINRDCYNASLLWILERKLPNLFIIYYRNMKGSKVKYHPYFLAINIKLMELT